MSGIERLNLNQSVVPVPSLLGRNCRRYRRDLLANPDEPIRRQMCDRCPSCIQMRNISEYSSERTPILAGSITLIRSSRFCDKMLIYLFMSVMVFGIGIAAYLLILQHEGIEEFEYFSREDWGIDSTFLKDIPPLHKPVAKILLLQLTPNYRRVTYEEYFSKEKFRIFNGEIPFNFYQEKGGKIFEGRGWNYQSDCGRQEGCDDVVTIGLIETNVSSLSTETQKLNTFLKYYVMDLALKPCYEVLVKDSKNGRDLQDLAFTLQELTRKDGTCEYFT